MNLRRVFVLLLASSLGFWATGRAQSEDPAAELATQLQEELPERKLRIATHVAPPFVIKNAQGAWEGISIDLWKEMASELHLDYEFVEVEPTSMLQAVENGDVDLAVGPITITALREAKLDFTHPYDQTGLSFGFDRPPSLSIFSSLGIIFSWGFLGAVFALLVAWFVAQLCFWVFEHQKSKEQRSGETKKDSSHNRWWSVIPLTTGGDEERASVTFLGRLVVVIWLSVSVMIVSHYAATMAVSIASSTLTTSERLKGSIVGTVQDSSSQTYLDQNRLRSKAYPSLLDAIQAVQAGEIDAVLYDRPILQFYTLRKEGGFLTLLPEEYGREDYGFALPQGSPRRDELNQAMLQVLSSETWQNIRFKYLGSG